jgi:hypothetical protein
MEALAVDAKYMKHEEVSRLDEQRVALFLKIGRWGRTADHQLLYRVMVAKSAAAADPRLARYR